MNAICVQEQVLWGDSLESKWELAQSWGFDGIELRAQGDGAFAARLPELRRAVAGGVKVPTVCVEMSHFIGAFDPELRRDAVEQMADQLRVMAILGGRGAMTPASWGMFSRRLPPFEPPRSADEDTAVMVDSLGTLGEIAATEGVALFLEPLNRYEDHMVNSLADAIRLIELVGLDSVRVAADTYHMNIEEADPAASLIAAGPYIGHIQASDSNRLEPGAGHIDWALFGATVQAIGYEGAIAVESRLSGPPEDVLPSVPPLSPAVPVSDRALMAATRVLAENWRGTYTVPAAGLYPHQWSWDSAFIAIGLRHISPRRAQQELDAIFSAQWADGRLPQIVFNPRLDVQYSPGASFWHSERIPGSPAVPTSGLIQPPNHALATLLVHQSDPETSERRRFLRRAYDSLLGWHDYLEERRMDASGLVHIVHPWESGMDNSPFWDAPLAAIDASFGSDIPRPDLLHADASHRPSNAEYGKYLYLAARYRDHDCDDRDETYPFVLEDPAVHALLIRSEWAMAEIAEQLGADAERHRRRARDLTDALEQLWDEELGCYVANDVVSGSHQRFRTVSGLIPLLVTDLPRTDELLRTLSSDHFGLGSIALVPSHDLTAPTFDSARYWRGPSWFNTAWLIAEALSERGFAEAARTLATQMADLGLDHDFPEYVDPHSGEPRGTQRFSWTAALSLDLYERLHAKGEVL